MNTSCNNFSGGKLNGITDESFRFAGEILTDHAKELEAKEHFPVGFGKRQYGEEGQDLLAVCKAYPRDKSLYWVSGPSAPMRSGSMF